MIGSREELVERAIEEIDESIEFDLPPKDLLGDLNKYANFDAILHWLDLIKNTDVIILALDTIAYGGLIASRRSTDFFDVIKSRLDKLKKILIEKNAQVYAFSSIMRISNNNCNEEEKEYWNLYGKKIFEYSFCGGRNTFEIPSEIIEDYLATRERNFKVNKLYLEWQKEGIFDTLIFSKDDCAECGFNINEAKELEKLGGKIKTGADEIPLSLISRAINKDINVFIEYIEPDYKDKISNYEDLSIEKSVLGQLELGKFNIVENIESADLVLMVNNFIEKQGELVMNWDTIPFNQDIKLPKKPYIIADLRYTNGSDNLFVEKILPQIDLVNFYGYAGWNTSANTLGSLLATAKVKFKSIKYNDGVFKKSQLIRFLDDWAYQANVRKQIKQPCDIDNLMTPYEECLKKILNCENIKSINYVYPWNRKFEIQVNIQ